MRSNTSIAPIISLAALADGMLFFLWRRVVSCGFAETPKIFEKSTFKLPKSSPKPSQIHPKTDQNPPQKRSKNEIWNGLRFGSPLCLGFPRIWRRLGRFRAPLGTNLEPSWGVWGRLGAVLGRPRGDLWRPWGV